MKRRLFPTLTASVLMFASWALVASACDHEKNTAAKTAAAKGGSCSVAAAAQCTPEQMAQCTPEQMAQCKAHGKNTAAAAASRAGRKHLAVTAANSGCAGMKNAAMTAGAGCGGKTSTAMAANSKCAGMMGAVFTSAPAGGSHCGGKTSAASSYDAVAAGGPGCSSHATTQTADGGAHHGSCDACADMSNCEEQLRSIGTQIQAVPLKNGVMFVYTASARSGVRAVQAAMTRRSDRLTAITASGDKATLCPECKSLRGSIASGKLSREMVNIEGGCLTLMTSNDPAMIAKLKAMAGANTARTKS